MHNGMKQQTQRIYEDVALLALDLFARIVAMRIDAGLPPPGLAGGITCSTYAHS
jgi:hypothetical protein